MNTVPSRSALGRRVASAAVVGLAATTLSLGLAGAASAANTIELQGTVTGAGGAPLQGVDVTAVDLSGNGLETVSTDSAGHYQFDDDVVVGSVKLEFDPSPMDPTLSLTSSLPYQLRWSGGSRYFNGASVTTVATADPSTPASVNINLPQYAAITGNLTVGADGHVATDSNVLMAYDSDDNSLVTALMGGTQQPMYDQFVDAATGNYRVVVDPSSPIRLQAFADDTSGATYLSQYWQNADTLAAARPIALSPGQTVSGINFRLTDVLAARQAPSISGTPVVGRPLTATPGTWSRNAGTEFSYTWMRGTTVVGTGATYTPTAADFGQQLNVVVQALNGEFKGQATSASTTAVRYPAEVNGSAKAQSGRQVRFAVKVVSAKQSPVKGKVVVMRGTKVVHKAVKLVKGKAVIVVKGQPKGKQTYTVLYKGNSLLSVATKTFTVKVHS